MKLIIDTELIKELLEIEWGYKGIRDDLDNLFLENGIPLEQIRAEIEAIDTTMGIKDYPFIPKAKVLEIIDKYR